MDIANSRVAFATENANLTSELKVRQPMRELCLLQLANNTKDLFTEGGREGLWQKIFTQSFFREY